MTHAGRGGPTMGQRTFAGAKASTKDAEDRAAQHDEDRREAQPVNLRAWRLSWVGRSLCAPSAAAGTCELARSES